MTNKRNYIYCVRENPGAIKDTAYYKIGHANDLERRVTSMQTANPRELVILFELGPFLFRDEAEDIESQLHSLLSRYWVRGEWFSVNPLTLGEFWDWIEAQILPISIREEIRMPDACTRRLKWLREKLPRKRVLQGDADFSDILGQGRLDLR